MNTLVRSIFGSRLYGLETENSDYDYKEVFVPSLEEVLLHGPAINQNISTKSGSDTKNTKEDVDTERFSIGTFIHHLVNGEMIAIDMMHSEPRHWEVAHPIWPWLVEQRAKFYTRSMKAYLGYIKKQVAKYSFKGSRLNIITAVRDQIRVGLDSYYFNNRTNMCQKGPRLAECIGKLDLNDHVRLVKSEGPNHIEIQFVEIFGSKYMLQDYAGNVVASLDKYLDGYGKRAHLAAENEGIDWKAVSHAFRACYQARAIYLDGGFSYPLPETDLIKKVKLGQMDYKLEVEPQLEKLHNEVLSLADNSKYPERVPQEVVDELLLSIYAHFYGPQVLKLISKYRRSYD